jgi:predicted membrane protein
MFLIALGVYIGAKHNFRTMGWLIPTTIGSIFLLENFFPEIRLHEFFWPILLIIIGVFVIIKPHKHKRWDRGNYHKGNWDGNHAVCGNEMEPIETSDSTINITAIMGGVRKIVLSKEFKGGEITTVMGGAEVNLTQADFQGRVVLEVNNILGGTKLLLPANWEVHSEAVVVLGGVEDKRPVMPDSQRNGDKILVIKGSCIFGGIDIRSY